MEATRPALNVIFNQASLYHSLRADHLLEVLAGHLKLQSWLSGGLCRTIRVLPGPCRREWHSPCRSVLLHLPGMQLLVSRGEKRRHGIFLYGLAPKPAPSVDAGSRREWGVVYTEQCGPASSSFVFKTNSATRIQQPMHSLEQLRRCRSQCGTALALRKVLELLSWSDGKSRATEN